MSETRIAFAASDARPAQEALAQLRSRYPNVPMHEANVIVALGGDGFMLHMLHATIGREVAIYGMNRGTVGFLMNDFDADNLPERLAAAEAARIHPIRMEAKTIRDETVQALAINEVSLLRETRQAAKLRIGIDGKTRLEELICDGALVATPAGSTAYNLSAHGPILPIDANLLALTPISAFRPRRWRGALLPHTAEVRFEILEAHKRPVSAVADSTEVREVMSVSVSEDRSIGLTMLFDAGRHLSERILSEQFTH